jgi:hypothetical protein
MSLTVYLELANPFHYPVSGAEDLPFLELVPPNPIYPCLEPMTTLA